MGGIIFFSLIGAFLLAVGFVYGLASILRKYYDVNHKEYESLRADMPKIVGRVIREADRWPMYSRPVLFRKIDHKAQVEFSQVHRAIDEAEVIESEIENIDLPEYPAKIPALFALPQNVKTIAQSSLFLLLVSQFATRVVEILKLVKTVNGYQVEETEAKQSVLASLEQMAEKLQAAQAKLETQAWASTDIDHVSWILLTTQRCHDTARERIKYISGDGLEYAVAHMYVRIGNASLEYYRVYAEGMEENKRYELDIFARFVKGSHAYLEGILNNENLSTLVVNDLVNWRKLRGADEQLDEFPYKLQEAEASLADFHTQRDAFEELERELEPLNMENEIARAQTVEAECTFYWYSYQEKPAFWQEVIGSAKLPTETLSGLKSELISNIRPALNSPRILQSHLSALIERLQAFFMGVLTGKDDLEKLVSELNRHKQAQGQVNGLMHRTSGAAGLAVSALETIVQDTSPQIKEDAVQLVQTYKVYDERANFVRGADFPDLLVNVLEYVVTANACIRRHEQVLIDLEAACTQSMREVQSSLNEIATILSFTPKVDTDISNQFTLLERDGRRLVAQFNPAGGYAALNRYLVLTQTLQREALRYLEPARGILQVFAETRLQAINQLRATQTQIEQVQNNLQYRWGWITTAMLPEIEKTQARLNTEVSDWNRHDARNWAEMNVRAAIEYCEKMINGCQRLLNELNESIAMIGQDQRKLLEKENAIRRMAEKNWYQIPPRDITEVVLLCDVAKQADTYSLVELSLKRAEQIVTRVATPGEREEAQKLIVNAGIYIGGNATMGDGNTLTGRDVS